VSRELTRARWGSGDQVLAPRWAIATVTGCYPATVSRRCIPVACDVRSRALLYDVDMAHEVLGSLLPGTPRGKRDEPVARDLGQVYLPNH
jgi:hypothetical protein